MENIRATAGAFGLMLVSALMVFTALEPVELGRPAPVQVAAVDTCDGGSVCTAAAL